MNAPRKQTNRLTQKQYRQLQDCIIDHSVEDEEGKRSVASSYIGFVPVAVAALGFKVGPHQISNSAAIVEVSFEAPVATRNPGKGLKARIAQLEKRHNTFYEAVNDYLIFKFGDDWVDYRSEVYKAAIAEGEDEQA